MAVLTPLNLHHGQIRLRAPSCFFLTSKYHWHFSSSYNASVSAPYCSRLWRSDEAVLLQAAGWAGQQQQQRSRKIQQGGGHSQTRRRDRRATHHTAVTTPSGTVTTVSVSSTQRPRGAAFSCVFRNRWAVNAAHGRIRVGVPPPVRLTSRGCLSPLGLASSSAPVTSVLCGNSLFFFVCNPLAEFSSHLKITSSLIFLCCPTCGSVFLADGTSPHASLAGL